MFRVPTIEALRRQALMLDHDAGHHQRRSYADCKGCAEGWKPSSVAVKMAGPR